MPIHSGLNTSDPKSAFGRRGTWAMVLAGVMLAASYLMVVSTNNKNEDVNGAQTKRFVVDSMDAKNVDWSSSRKYALEMHAHRLAVKETVIGPDPTLAAQQRAIEASAKQLVAAHNASAMAFKTRWNQIRDNAIAKKDITQAEWTEMVYVQVQYHIQATARDVQLFIEDAAHGLAVFYQYKNYLMDDAKKAVPDFSGESTRAVVERVRGAKEVLHAMKLKPDIVNKALAAAYKSTAQVKLAEYNAFKASAEQKKQAWLADLQRIQAQRTATIVEFVSSTTLFTAYKIDKTTELVKDYEYMINEGLYIRWEFGNNVVLDETVRDLVDQALEKLDEVEHMAMVSLF